MPRDPLLAQIHIARKELALDDDSYRAILLRLTAQESSAGLSDTQRRKVISEFKRLGWKPRAGKTTDSPRAKSQKPYVRLIFALWGELKREGLWTVQSRASLRAFVKKMTGVDDPEFLGPREASCVIEAMKKMKARGATYG